MIIVSLKMNYKNLKYQKKEIKISDPIRYPKIISNYENQSKKDFSESLKIEQEHLYGQMDKLIK